MEMGLNSRFGKKAISRLSRRVDEALKRIPEEPVRGKIRISDIKQSRYRESRDLSGSRDMNDVMRAAGFTQAFMPSIVESYKEKLAMLLTGGEISGKALKGRAFVPYARRYYGKMENLIKEAFFGRTGKLQEALEITMPAEAPLRKAIEEGFRDSFAKKAARQVTAETQWLYERKVQAPWIQKRWFGMFGTWSSNYIDFLIRHFKHIGTPVDKAKKAALMGMSYGSLLAGLQYAGISPAYVLRSFTLPTGGPLFTSLMDVAGIVSPGVPEYERGAKLRRLARTAKETMPLIPAPMGQIKSLYQAQLLPKAVTPAAEKYFGPAPYRKPPVQGIIGAPVSRQQLSEYQRTKQITWDTSKLTPTRVKAIRKLREDLRTFDLARKTHEDPDIQRLAEERYVELYWRLREVLEPVVKYVPGDPGLVADRILESKEAK